MSTLRILVVDDDEDVALSLADYLELDGHHVDTSHSGRHGIEIGLRERYDVVIIDVGLPDVSGFEVMDRIAAERPGVRILMITGHSALDLDQARISRGNVGVMTKPVSPEELSRRLGGS